MATSVKKPNVVTFDQSGYSKPTTPQGATVPSKSAPASGQPYQTNSGPFVTTPNLDVAVNSGTNPSGPPSFATVPGPYDPLRAQLKAQNPGIPASFIDDEIDQFNKGRTRDIENAANDPNLSQLTPDSPNAAAVLSGMIGREWSNEKDRNRYIQTDAKAIQTASSTQQQNNAQGIVNGLPQQQTAAANQYWNQNVQPAIQRQNTALSAQVSGDRSAEGQIGDAANTYNGTVNQLQALRMAGIDTTNQANSALGQQYFSVANNANNANLGAVAQMGQNAQGVNSANAGLINQNYQVVNQANNTANGLVGQLSQATQGANATANQNLGGFQNQIGSANNQQLAALGTLTNSIGQANSAQDRNLLQFVQQISTMNGQDRAAYTDYINKTNPLLAQQIAQLSNQQYVGNQEDVVNQYKNLINPEITPQERLMASLARQNFESQDKSSRDAVMAQLAGRGLRSGGLVIANQQATQQQLAQDRMNAELGLQANAQGRSLAALGGYSTASNTLRNADDAMKQFQDVYKQNEMNRVGNVALQQNQQDLATSNQIGNRYAQGFDAGTATVNNNFNRNQTGFEDASTSVNNNFNRTQAGYNAAQDTNSANYNRTSGSINTGLDVNNQNTLRSQGALGANIAENTAGYNRNQDVLTTGIGVTNTNATRSQGAIDSNVGINNTNSTRYQAGLDSGNTVAGNVLNSSLLAPNSRIANLGSEASNASGAAGQAIGGAGTQATIQSGLSQATIDALTKAGILKSNQAAIAAASQN